MLPGQTQPTSPNRRREHGALPGERQCKSRPTWSMLAMGQIAVRFGERIVHEPLCEGLSRMTTR